MKKYQNGFSAPHILLLLVVVGVMALAGWYVTKANDNTNVPQPNNSSTENSSSENDATTTEETKAWLLVTSGKGAFSIRIPDGWKLTKETETDSLSSSMDPSDLVYTKGEAATITEIPGGGGDSPIRFSMFTATKNYQGWTSDKATKTEFVTNAGLKGIRYAETHGKQTGDGIGPAEGEVSYEYLLEKNGIFVHAAYRILPGDSNNLEAVEMSLKTLNIL